MTEVTVFSSRGRFHPVPGTAAADDRVSVEVRTDVADPYNEAMVRNLLTLCRRWEQ